jgi:hypothetical protein
MNFPLRLSSIVAFVSLCAGAHAFAAKSALRFDGIYRCSVPKAQIHFLKVAATVGTMTSYLRFYPNGIVVATNSSGTLHDVSKWLNRERRPNFHYRVRGNSIEFTEDRGGALSYVYSGTISTGSLRLFIAGYSHREFFGYVPRAYEFAHVDFSR